jgi:hypothetical protein
MHEIIGDLFESELADAICITTNGFVNSQGANTMGRGCAGEAKVRWPGIQMAVGTVIQGFGNVPVKLTFNDGDGRIYLQECKQPAYPRHYVPYHIFTFPTKPEMCKESELLDHYRREPYLGREPYPGWMAKSSLDLILRSAQHLITQVNAFGFKSVVLPRPGCGAGNLSWKDEVRPYLSEILDDRFWVIHNVR